MIENSACQGCCINPLWYNQWPFSPPETHHQPLQFFKSPALSGLTEEEKAILYKLVEVYSLFSSLDKKSPADCGEFIDAIHKCQQLIALRVARRIDVDVWHQPE